MGKPDSDLLIDLWKALERQPNKHGAALREKLKRAYDTDNGTNQARARVMNAEREARDWLRLMARWELEKPASYYKPDESE